MIDRIQVADSAIGCIDGKGGGLVTGSDPSSPRSTIVMRKAFLRTHVTTVGARMAELLPAVFALVGLLPGVNPGMLLEVVLVLEGLLALAAEVLSGLFLVTEG